MRFLKLSFFHQTASPGPLRDSLKQFPFLANFRRVMYILKRLPGVPDTREFWLPVSRIPGSFDSLCPGYREVGTPRCPGHRGSGKSPVSGTPGVVFLTVHCFFQTSGHFLHPLKQQSIKKQCGSNIYFTRTFGSCFQNFPDFIISLVTTGVPDTGEFF